MKTVLKRKIAKSETSICHLQKTEEVVKGKKLYWHGKKTKLNSILGSLMLYIQNSGYRLEDQPRKPSLVKLLLEFNKHIEIFSNPSTGFENQSIGTEKLRDKSVPVSLQPLLWNSWPGQRPWKTQLSTIWNSHPQLGTAHSPRNWVGFP